MLHQLLFHILMLHYLMLQYFLLHYLMSHYVNVALFDGALSNVEFYLFTQIFSRNTRSSLWRGTVRPMV